ncbi:MAG TPA: adenylate/guanylate cyclase domain-containing protein, partial [Leptospiraceae bacterium]|nr:adenylate/guanylate cyclase domain-containing protein [Leptospiraceae bacterium]
MAFTVVDSILRDRAFRNEKKVAVARFALFSMAMMFDILAYLGFIEYTAVRPSMTTLLMDVLVVVPSAVLLILLLRNVYHSLIKFFAITFDYSLIAMMLIFDPTIPKGGQQIYWVILVASLFPFFMNLLRYSRTGTLYSSILTLALFTGVSFHYNQGEAENLVPMFFNLIMMLLIGYSITSSSRKMMEEANTKKMMERYLPPQLVSELYKKNASIEPGGEMRKVTVLFSDIRSFTSISESMKPDEVVSFLNEYLSAMTDTVFHYGGTLDKFVGDAIMTVFGAPVERGDDAVRAVQTAVSMIKALAEFNRLHNHLKAPLEIGIGIHTGEVIAGNIGSEKRLDYTVIGDNVNLSSRIESLTKYYKCSILISQSTYDELEKESSAGTFAAREADNVTVKGRSKSIRIYEIMVFNSEEERKRMLSLRDDFEKGLLLY